MDDGNVGFAEQMNGLSGDGNVSAEHKLADIVESGACEFLALFGDEQLLAAFADEGALFLDVERQGVVACGVKATDGWSGGVGRDVLKAEGFIGQTDGVERTSDTFGAVVQGRRQGGGASGLAGVFKECKGSGFKLRGKGDINARS